MNHDTIETLIRDFIRLSTLPLEGEHMVFDESTNTLWYSLRSSDRGALPYKRKEEIAGAINHLVRRMVEQAAGEEATLPSLIVDIDGAEKKRIENLRALAHMMAERSKFFKSNIELDPMPPSSRRIVHEYLAGRPNIRTNSTGDGDKRRVVIEFYEE